MSREQLWTRAADEMRTDEDPRWHAVADWLRTEAALQLEFENVVELWNMAIEQKSGVKGYFKLVRQADGNPTFIMDANEGATAVALAYLDSATTPARTDSTPTEEAE